jgi:hypothetical protein
MNNAQLTYRRPRFAWLPGDDRQYDLVVTLNDAMRAI